jgi:hypothetical protein
MPNHRGNLSGAIAPPLSNKRRPLRMITIRSSTINVEVDKDQCK